MNYENLLNNEIKEIQPSGIRKFFDMASQYKNVISLTVGEPDFTTPQAIREAAIKSIKEGKTHYTTNRGLIELRKEICKYFKKRYNTEYNPETECIVTSGGSEGLDITLRAILNKGDDVIVLNPGYVAYSPLIKMAGGNPILINLSQNNQFKLAPNLLKSAITSKTKATLLNYPNNPTGKINSNY